MFKLIRLIGRRSLPLFAPGGLCRRDRRTGRRAQSEPGVDHQLQDLQTLEAVAVPLPQRAPQHPPVSSLGSGFCPPGLREHLGRRSLQ